MPTCPIIAGPVTIVNGVTSSDSDTDSTLSTSETNSIDSSSEFSPTPLKKVRTAAGPIELGNSMFFMPNYTTATVY